jgi:hypothetical protein
MPAFDIQETTVQIDHTNKLVHFYTTRRSVFLGLVHRNPNFIRAAELNPGYEVEYPLDQVRGVDKLLAPSDGSARIHFLTEEERHRFAQAGERLVAARGPSKAESP